eukprot:symbB.v1.2.024434.t1/scaffold2308.1/size82747/2
MGELRMKVTWATFGQENSPTTSWQIHGDDVLQTSCYVELADIAFAKQFAKATGDLGFLSTNDVDLIALTVRLHREAGLTLKDRPAPLGSGQGQVNFDWAPQSAKDARQEAVSAASETGSSSGWAVVGRKGRGPMAKEVDDEAPRSAAADVDAAESSDVTEVPDEADDVEEEDEESEDGSSAGEWVTEENKHRFGIGVGISQRSFLIAKRATSSSIHGGGILEVGLFLVDELNISVASR